MTARGIVSSQEARFNALQQKHALLSSQIQEVHNTPSATDFYIRQLKKQKLHLKDEIEKFRQTG